MFMCYCNGAKTCETDDFQLNAPPKKQTWAAMNLDLKHSLCYSKQSCLLKVTSLFLYIYVHPPLDYTQRSMGVEVTNTCLQHLETKNTTQCGSFNYRYFLNMLIYPLNMPALNDSTQLYVYIHTRAHTCILLHIDTVHWHKERHLP
jgi:hypothetical protein